MLEDSITSSPSKTNRSIHKARLQRKIRRRYCASSDIDYQIEANECEIRIEDVNTNQQQDKKAILDNIYWEVESTASSHMNRTYAEPSQKYGADFDPFEDELLLAVADRLDCEHPGSKRNIDKIQQLKQGQGFLKCSQLPPDIDHLKEDILEQSPGTNKTYPNGSKTQFGVTESELLHFCAEAEQKEKTLEDTPPPKRYKSVVESILEDFCCSPLSPPINGEEQQCSPVHIVKSTPAQLLPNAEDDQTPVFHFKNKPLRTYGDRRKKTSACTSIVKRFESVTVSAKYAEVNYDDDDDKLSNCSSGLSIQEDLTQPMETADTSCVEINNSARVCENLLNLSAFFTQQPIMNVSQAISTTEIHQTTKEKMSQQEGSEVAKIEPDNDTFAFDCAKVANLIKEIVFLRKEFKCFFSRNCICDVTDFHGFDETSAEVDETLLHNDGQHDCTIECPDVFAVPFFEDDVCSNSSAVTEESIARYCTPSPLRKSSTRDDELFSESEDEWQDDCDFFKNFKTQDIVRVKSPMGEVTSKNQLSPPKFNGFVLASKKPISISETSKRRAEQILAEVDNTLNLDLKEKKCEFNGFMLASKKPIVISEAAKERASKILSEVEDNLNLEFKKPEEELSFLNFRAAQQHHQTKGLMCDKNMPNFQTASKKHIKISMEAKKRAEAVLSNLPPLLVVKKERMLMQTPSRATNDVKAEDIEFEDIQLSEWMIDNGEDEKIDVLNNTQSTFQGIQTASKKPIDVSEESKKRVMKLLSDLHDLQKGLENEINVNSENFDAIKMQQQMFKSSVDSEYPICTGFRTASRKAIGISEEAKKKADKILETLPDFPKQKENLTKNTEEDVEEGSQLSANGWRQSNQITTTITVKTAHKQKLDTSETILETKVQTPLQTPKIINESTSKCDSLRTPLASHFDNVSAAKSTPIEPKLCLTSLAKSAIISRKNLLSLSKRKKIKYNEDKNMLEVDTLATPTASHIGRISTAPTTPNVQEFFATVPDASTPRPSRERYELPLSCNEIDVDFKKIEWEQSHQESPLLNNTKTPSTSKLDSSCENITVISVNPSPKMRIARLHMYGKPPPVSPILMSSTNNCRPSGLRRSRSMKKQQ